MNTDALRLLIDEQNLEPHEIETLLDRIPALANEEQTSERSLSRDAADVRCLLGREER